jgi:hypothetical protein
MVPLAHGEMARAKVGEALVAPGMVTLAVSEAGQLVSFPAGTSENWYANCAEADGASGTAEGAAFAGGDNETDSPLTIVTVNGAPLPEKSATVG